MSSNINPNIIDGSYPVAGQDNNSQGFRDNFTNTKTNFQYAENEINDLQSKVILKAALTGTTLDNNMADALLVGAQLQDISEVKTALSTTSGSVTINYSTAPYQTISTTGSISLAFSNFPPTGQYGYVKVQINITDVTHTLTLPAAVSLGTSGIQGYSAGTITFGSTGTYEFAFGTYDAGTTITVFDLNRALTNFTSFSVSSFTATGNITAGNVNTTGSVSSTGNIVGGNITTPGLVSATGNVTGGNLTTAGVLTVNSGAAASAIVNGAGNAVGNIGSSTGWFGNIFATSSKALYADLAEVYESDKDYAPGTVVSFGGSKEITMSTMANDPAVAGVISANPSYLMNNGLTADHRAIVALTGRVPTSVIGTVSKGSMMVSAGNGCAMACAAPAMGTVIGKALENFDGESGIIEIVVGRM